MYAHQCDDPLPKFTPHSLRHTYVSIMAAVGTPASYVMDQVGHTSEAMTFRIYRPQSVPGGITALS